MVTSATSLATLLRFTAWTATRYCRHDILGQLRCTERRAEALAELAWKHYSPAESAHNKYCCCFWMCL